MHSLGLDLYAHVAYKVIALRWYETLNILHAIFSICDRVCIKGPLVWRYKTEISAVKVYWSFLVGFREIGQSGSLLHKEAVDSSFRLISKLESTCSRNQYFSWRFNLEILKQVMQQRHTNRLLTINRWEYIFQIFYISSLKYSRDCKNQLPTL